MNVQPNKRRTQNVKVVVRVRPLTKQEIDINSRNIVQYLTQKEIATKEKKYTFDHVFRAECPQIDVYLSVIAPMIPDIVAGYNCTVFAYGQTGTGKTYTMTGGDPNSEQDWREDPTAGCIPRAAINIFDHLNSLGSSIEYTVRVSYLELYNEEVRDLLSDDDKLPPLTIFNDPNHKGSVCVQGLKEITVCNRNDIYCLLEKGTKKRQTAPTLMNHQSSRSHTVFTITVHTRESVVSGEDILKMGKLNLVDLAGSESIARSGAKDIRASELANINRSLLTLGRVIQTLVDKKQQHVPYRDSKLTRILQDSLGGKTKTCIIATISPASTSYEETVSTLDYASRARDITNCPQVNEKTTKTRMIKDLNDEVERLRKDLEAARQATGFYMDIGNYRQMVEELETYKGQIVTKNDHIKDLVKQLNELEEVKKIKFKEWEDLSASFETTRHALIKYKSVVKEKDKIVQKEQFLTRVLEERENELTDYAMQLLNVADTSTKNEHILHDKLQRLHNFSARCKSLATGTLPLISNSLTEITECASGSLNTGQEILRKINDDIDGIDIGLRDISNNLENASQNMKETLTTNGLKQQERNKFMQEKVIEKVQSHCQNVGMCKTICCTEVADVVNKSKELGDERNRQLILMAEMFEKQNRETNKRVSKTINSSFDKEGSCYRGIEDLLEECRERVLQQNKEEERRRLQLLQLVEESKRQTEANLKQLEYLSMLSDFFKQIEESSKRAHQETVELLENNSSEFNRDLDKMLILSSVISEIEMAHMKNFELQAKKNISDLEKESQTLKDNVKRIEFPVDNSTEGLTSHIDSTFNDLSESHKTLHQKVNDVACSLLDIKSNEEKLLEDIQSKVEKMKGIIIRECIDLKTPVLREGNTPIRREYNYPRKIIEKKPREVLLQQFEGDASFDESFDKENIPVVDSSTTNSRLEQE